MKSDDFSFMKNHISGMIIEEGEFVGSFFQF